MRGHLFVGNALFDLGERNAAGTHSKHPTSELYAPMGVEFAARGSTGFATELQADADAVSGADDETVAARYADLVVAITESEDAIDISTVLVVKVINHLIREAAREYAIGIVDGKLANAHEYQDAYGFTQVALLWAQRARSIASENEVPVFNRIVARLEGLGDMWPAARAAGRSAAYGGTALRHGSGYRDYRLGPPPLAWRVTLSAGHEGGACWTVPT